MRLNHGIREVGQDLPPLAVLKLRLRLGVQNDEPGVQTAATLWRLAEELRGVLATRHWGEVVRFLVAAERVLWPRGRAD